MIIRSLSPIIADIINIYLWISLLTSFTYSNIIMGSSSSFSGEDMTKTLGFKLAVVSAASGILTVVLTTLKTTEVIDWSWWRVLSPLWITVILFAVLLIIILLSIATTY